MKTIIILISLTFFNSGFSQSENNNLKDFKIKYFLKNQFAIFTLTDTGNVYFYDLINDKLINYFKTEKGTHKDFYLSPNEKKIVIQAWDKNERHKIYVLDAVTGQIISLINPAKIDSIKANYHICNISYSNNCQDLIISFYHNKVGYKKTVLLKVGIDSPDTIKRIEKNQFDTVSTTYITDKQYSGTEYWGRSLNYINSANHKIIIPIKSKRSYHYESSPPPFFDDQRNTEFEQNRFSYPLYIDTIKNDSFGLYNFQKNCFINKYYFPKYRLFSANISPKKEYYYAALIPSKKQNGVRYRHYIFLTKVNKYYDLSLFDNNNEKTKEIYRISFAENDSFFATNSSNGSVLIYQLYKNFKETKLNQKKEKIEKIEFSPNANYFITYSVYKDDTTAFMNGVYDNKSYTFMYEKPLYHLKIWDCKTMKPLVDLRTTSKKYGFSNDDKYFAYNKDPNIKISSLRNSADGRGHQFSENKDSVYISILNLSTKKETNKVKHILTFLSDKRENVYLRDINCAYKFTDDNKKIIVFYDGGDYSDPNSVDEIYDVESRLPMKEFIKSKL